MSEASWAMLAELCGPKSPIAARIWFLCRKQKAEWGTKETQSVLRGVERSGPTCSASSAPQGKVGYWKRGSRLLCRGQAGYGQVVPWVPLALQ